MPNRRYFVNRTKEGAANRLNLRRFDRKRRRKRRLQVREIVRRKQSQALLNGLAPDRNSTQRATLRKLSERNNRISLDCFSFLDSPEETILRLVEIAEVDAVGVKYSIDFEDEYCLDVGPYMLLGLMQQEMAETCDGGKMSRPLMKVLEAVGLRTFLKMGLFPINAVNDVLPVRLTTHSGIRQNRLGFESHESAKERVARRFSESINNWLMALRFMLTNNGSDWVRSLLAEVLDNSRHANPADADGGWSVAGFMVARERADGTPRFICHIGIVTLGATFAQSLLNSEEPKILSNIRSYASAHKNSSELYDYDALITTCALMDKVSCEGTYADRDIGGCGMSSLINMMNGLGKSSRSDEQPEMAIISGNSCLALKPPYNQMEQVDQSYLQAFNVEQDLNQPPSDAHVYKLKHRVPGTVISLRFTIDPNNLSESVV
ncbi:hypothetical protein [Pelagibius sp. Alg239-R121]|uniref:hypothetical protein n=1 Tax=Pelagibius sp. Alg239-R121 TaxID=2993448 RepID=UPI0024A74CD7|nr:hypothetical protein [Pelagibius sp. Alg239-R121]